MGSPSQKLILFPLYENRGEKPMPRLMPSKNLPAPHQPDTDCCTEFLHMPRGEMAPHGSCRFNGRYLTGTIPVLTPAGAADHAAPRVGVPR
jgi:hypothetical protein